MGWKTERKSLFRVGEGDKLSHLTQQVRRILPAVLVCLIVALLALTIVFAIARSDDVLVSELTRDPAAVLDVPFYYGLLSHLSIIAWAGTAGAFLVGGLLATGENQAVRWFLLAGAALSLLLGLDDALMIHEEVMPDYIGIPEKGILLSYVLLVIGWSGCFWRQILQTDYLLLGLSLGFFGLSMVIDWVLPLANRTTFIEDYLKFIGILLWLAYAAQASLRLNRN